MTTTLYLFKDLS